MSTDTPARTPNAEKLPTGSAHCSSARSPDYVIEIDAVNGPCWLAEDNDGDHGRTMRIEFADRFATYNEAIETWHAVRRRYPNRQYDIRQLPVA